ncbi:MAG: alpha/beta hydrolase [Methylotenera sp.]|nr:alpha/beta hydrolase [Oligoflexia bacterium]
MKLIVPELFLKNKTVKFLLETLGNVTSKVNEGKDRVEDLAESLLSLQNPAFRRKLRLELFDKSLPVTFKTLELVSLSRAIDLAERIFLTPDRYEAPEAEKAFLATGHAFHFEGAEGRKIAAWSWGDGPTVFLVHGWSGRGGQLHHFVQPLLEGGYSVVLFDAPGHGQTEGEQSTMIEFMQTVFNAVQSAGPAAAIIAHSMGAPAVALAVKQGLTVPKLIFIAPPVGPAEFSREFASYYGLSEKIRSGLQKRLEKKQQVKWKDLNLTDVVKTLTSRILVIHDREDRDVSYKTGEKVAKAAQDSELFLTRGLGHRRILKSPEVIARTVRFISSEAGGAAKPAAARQARKSPKTTDRTS